jgi:hypothetical protein
VDACGKLRYPKEIPQPRPPVVRKNGTVAPLKPISDIDKRLMGVPGGLTAKKSETVKYFGAESRVKFFERYQYMHEQRHHASTSSDHVMKHLKFDSDTAGGNINSDHNIKNAADGGNHPFVDSHVDSLAGDIPFYPIRATKNVKVSTKVIIRTQSLDDSFESYSQIKLIPKPSFVKEIHSDVEEGGESDESDDVDIYGQSAVEVKREYSQADMFNDSLSNIHKTVESILAKNSNILQHTQAIGKTKVFSLLDPITPRIDPLALLAPVVVEKKRHLLHDKGYKSLDSTPVRKTKNVGFSTPGAG